MCILVNKKIQIKNLGDIANIGFIVGENSIAVIDTGSSVIFAKKMYKKIREISELPISHILLHIHIRIIF